MKPSFGKRVLSWFKRSNSAKSASAGLVQNNDEKSGVQGQTPIETTVGTFESEKQLNGGGSTKISETYQSQSVDDGYSTAKTIAAPEAVHSPISARRPVSSSTNKQSQSPLRGFKIVEKDGQSELSFLDWPNSTKNDIKMAEKEVTPLAGNPELSFLQWPNSTAAV
jgi:hypothetical protein